MVNIKIMKDKLVVKIVKLDIIVKMELKQYVKLENIAQLKELGYL